MSGHPSDVLDRLAASGQEPGGAVAVVRNGVVECDHAVRSLGFQVDEEDGRVQLGMGGAGGCSAWTEPAAGFGAAYVSRRLGTHEQGEAVWQAVGEHFRP